jgi:hypothetical protein
MVREWSAHGKEIYTNFWWENLKEKCQWENRGLDGRIILKCIKKYDGR